VWSVSGDGGFQMNIQELGTIMEHEIDIKIVLMNNGYLGMVRQWQTLFYDGRYAGTPMKNPDLRRHCQCLRHPLSEGCPSWTRIDEPIRNGQPPMKGAFWWNLLCDPSEIVLPMVPAGGGIADMIVSNDTCALRRNLMTNSPEKKGHIGIYAGPPRRAQQNRHADPPQDVQC
jgi:acetolactate synthase-1/2/3 large subunit